MAGPAVSVIIPTHNRIPLLQEALDSVHAQTFRDYEVIVVDDGSDSPIEPLIADHPTRPRVFRQPSRRGPAAARNRGIREAVADTVAFLDSDDLWLANKLERFVDALSSRQGPQIYYGPMQPVDFRGRVVPGRTKPCHRGHITEQLFCSSFVHVPAVVCRKSLLVRMGGFDETLPVCEDYDLWLRLSVEEPFGLLDEPLAKRRLHSNRLSKTDMSRNLAVKAEVLRRFYESTRTNGHLDPAVAMRRLARAWYVAGRAAFRGHRFGRACEMCQTSRSYGAAWGRTVPLGWASRAFVYFFGNGDGDIPEAPPEIVST
ncbi:MAG: glycosyltransferase [Phycisphaerae bacterium]